MPVPSQMSVRRFPDAVHARLRVAYAVGWDALVSTHAEQATLFVEEFASRIPVLEALEHYFEVVPVPLDMQEAVRVRTLSHLDLDWIPVTAALPQLGPWAIFRPDKVIEVMRYRRQFHERTRQLARMVGARAAEAVLVTHVGNALSLAVLLRGQAPPDDVVTHYIKEFALPLAQAHAVFQRAQAAMAGEQLAAAYRDPPPAALPSGGDLLVDTGPDTLAAGGEHAA